MVRGLRKHVSGASRWETNLGVADELAKLGELRASGVIEDEEFQRLKTDLISRNSSESELARPQIRRRTVVIASLVGLALVVAVGAVIAAGSRADETSPVTAASSSSVVSGVTATIAATSTLPESTTSVLSAEDEASIRAQLIKDAVGTATAFLRGSIDGLNSSLRRQSGPLWAPSGLGDDQIAECAMRRYVDFRSLDTQADQIIDQMLAEDAYLHSIADVEFRFVAEKLGQHLEDINLLKYFDLVCAGFSDADARSRSGV